MMYKQALLLSLMIAMESCVTSKIEEPKFNVILSESEFEIREYEPRIIAETRVSGEFRDAPNRGFRILADFIFGNNTKKADIAMTAPVSQEKKSESIAMTAPVSQEKASDNQWIITFTMPSKYTMASLPKPNDSRIVIRQLPPGKFAAVRFSGMNSQDTVKEKTALLRSWLTSKNHKAKGSEPLYARYNPPWTPWFWRRNEILIELE
jgi:effector-binding domain-containing protein